MSTIGTIGYATATLPGLIERIAGEGVTLVVDVRAIAASRRPGFAKGQLAAGLAERGLGYLHLRDLGTPADGRAAARAGRHLRMRTIVEAHLTTIEAQAALALLAARVARGERICLLCLEADPRHCHRSIVAEHLARTTGADIRHLVD
mgnify:CR=1 FL=1